MEHDGFFYHELVKVRDYACKAAGLDPVIAGWKTAVDAMTKQLTDAQATVEALQRDNRTYIDERHENMKQLEGLQALRDELDRLRANLVNCVARLEAYYGEDYPAVRDAKAVLTPAGGGQNGR